MRWLWGENFIIVITCPINNSNHCSEYDPTPKGRESILSGGSQRDKFIMGECEFESILLLWAHSSTLQERVHLTLSYDSSSRDFN